MPSYSQTIGMGSQWKCVSQVVRPDASAYNLNSRYRYLTGTHLPMG
jgi:hypothetical protein